MSAVVRPVPSGMHPCSHGIKLHLYQSYEQLCHTDYAQQAMYPEHHRNCQARRKTCTQIKNCIKPLLSEQQAERYSVVAEPHHTSQVKPNKIPVSLLVRSKQRRSLRHSRPDLQPPAAPVGLVAQGSLPSDQYGHDACMSSAISNPCLLASFCYSGHAFRNGDCTGQLRAQDCKLHRLSIGTGTA